MTVVAPFASGPKTIYVCPVIHPTSAAAQSDPERLIAYWGVIASPPSEAEQASALACLADLATMDDETIATTDATTGAAPGLPKVALVDGLPASRRLFREAEAARSDEYPYTFNDVVAGLIPLATWRAQEEARTADKAGAS